MTASSVLQVAPQRTPHTARRPVVMVVDDMPINRKVLSAQVRRLGYEPLEARNGLEALELYEREAAAAGPASECAVAAILLDLQMPVMDGWQAAQRLRLRHPALRIVACTACCLSELLPMPIGQSLEAFTLSCGADCCVNKPLTLNQLSATLQALAVPCPGKQQLAGATLPQ